MRVRKHVRPARAPTGRGQVTDSHPRSTQPRAKIEAGAWRWLVLAMFAIGYGANQFVPLLPVYRHTLALSDV